LKLALYLNKKLVTELSDEETENIFFEYLQENHPEFQPDDDDYIEVIVTDH
tara:strand:+ start:272 stop:424 length:153 start_codon:yes stop_codon:yes gene_type:complete